MEYQGKHIAHLLREELGDTNPYTALNERIWFTLPDAHVWIHKDYELPKCMMFMLIKNL